MRVQLRHVLIYVLAGICCWLLLWVWNQRHIKRFHLETRRGSLIHHAHLMETLFQLNSSTLDASVDALREKIPFWITIIDARGLVVADSFFSGGDLQRVENQLQAKEIVQAAHKGQGSDLRYFSLTDGWFLYAAVPISTGGFIRLATPVSGSDPSPEPQ